MTISDFQKFYESSLPDNSATRVIFFFLLIFKIKAAFFKLKFFLQINWYNLIANLFIAVPGVTIEQSEVVVIINKDYFVKLADLIRRTPARVVGNYNY